MARDAARSAFGLRQQRCRLGSRKRASGSACASKLAHQEKAVALLPQSKTAILAVAAFMGRMPLPHRPRRAGPCGPWRS